MGRSPSGPFAFVPSRAYRDTRLNSQARDVLGIICAHTKGDRRCILEVASIAVWHGTTERNVRKLLALLREAGYLALEERYNSTDGLRDVNAWIVLHDVDLAADHDRLGPVAPVQGGPVTPRQGGPVTPVQGNKQYISVKEKDARELIVDEGLREFGEGLGFTAAEVDVAADHWRDHLAAEGRTPSDPAASFRNWLRKRAELHRKRGTKVAVTHSAPDPLPVTVGPEVTDDQRDIWAAALLKLSESTGRNMLTGLSLNRVSGSTAYIHGAPFVTDRLRAKHAHDFASIARKLGAARFELVGIRPPPPTAPPQEECA